MAAETIFEIPARRFLFGLLPSAGKLGIIEGEAKNAIGLLIGGERVYFRNVVDFEKGKWDEGTQYYPVHFASDVGKKYTLNLGFYFDPSSVGEAFRTMLNNWQYCRSG
jgi:hypothetical protein